MQTTLSVSLWFGKTMKRDKSETEKCQYFLLPNNKYSSWCSRWQEVKITGRPGSTWHAGWIVKKSAKNVS